MRKKKRRTQAKDQPHEYLTLLRNGWPVHYRLYPDGQLELLSVEWNTGNVPFDHLRAESRKRFEVEVRNAIQSDWLNFGI